MSLTGNRLVTTINETGSARSAAERAVVDPLEHSGKVVAQFLRATSRCLPHDEATESAGDTVATMREQAEILARTTCKPMRCRHGGRATGDNTASHVDMGSPSSSRPWTRE